MEKEKGLYIHIPFCEKKCHYCGFLSFPADENQKERYTQLLIKEIELEGKAQNHGKIDTVFLGGGTPSLLEAYQIYRIMEAVDQSFSLNTEAEITLEGNPNSLSREKLKNYRQSRVNRLSIGIQSFDDELLKLIGRCHNRTQSMVCYQEARKVGFENINIDLIFGLPEQNGERWGKTLSVVGDLDPEHLSFYSLQLEEKTPFYRAYGQGALILAEEEEREMYAQGVAHLKKNNYVHYEISNGAKEGLPCRHNMKYWNMEEFIGVGLGASFFHGGRRGKKTTSWNQWTDSLEQGLLPVDPRETKAESREEAKAIFCFTALRKKEGIQFKRYHNLFGTDFIEDYHSVMEELLQYRDRGNLILNHESLQLTVKGIGMANEIMACFV